MPIIDSKTGKVLKDYSIDELKTMANHMRGLDMISLCSAKSGHSGGTLSMMDILAALYLKVANHDPNNPDWADRDRIIWSAGHKAPALYISLAVSGYFPEEELPVIRNAGKNVRYLGLSKLGNAPWWQFQSNHSHPTRRRRVNK